MGHRQRLSSSSVSVGSVGSAEEGAARAEGDDVRGGETEVVNDGGGEVPSDGAADCGTGVLPEVSVAATGARLRKIE